MAGGPTSIAQVRDKTFFAEAPDPGQVLSEFFDALGPGVTERCAPLCNEPRPQRCPLILISQLPRSGGSLLSQLFDGHPQLYAYPYEMRIGYPGKSTWPAFDPREGPERLFAKLFHTELGQFAARGYRKPGKAKTKHDRLSFDYSPIAHYQAFISLLDSRSRWRKPWSYFAKFSQTGREASVTRARRQVLDSYFAGFFSAWPGGKPADPRYISGFVPNLALTKASIDGFFRDYPDGRLISIMRSPADWFVSRRAHTKHGVVRYADLENQMANWNKMANNAHIYRRRYGDRFLLLSFRELVTNREGTMRRVCKWGSIDFHPSLLQQTFGGQEIMPNTNFEDKPDRLSEAVLERSSQLDASEKALVHELTKAMQARLAEAGVLL